MFWKNKVTRTRANKNDFNSVQEEVQKNVFLKYDPTHGRLAEFPELPLAEVTWPEPNTRMGTLAGLEKTHDNILYNKL